MRISNYSRNMTRINTITNNYSPLNTNEKWSYILIGTVWASVIVGFVLIFFLKATGINTDFKSALSFCIYSILVLRALPALNRRINRGDIVRVFVLWTLYLSHFLLFPENQEMLVHYFPIYSVAILYYFIGRVCDIDGIFRLLRIASIGNIICYVFYFLVFSQRSGYSGVAETDAENMEAAYQILPSVLFMLQIAVNNLSLKRIKHLDGALDLLSGFGGLFFIAMMGSRGPLVCTIFLLLCNVLFFIRTHVVYKVLLILLLVIIFLNLNYIILFLLPLTEKLGLSSRVFDLFIEGTFFSGEASADIRTDITGRLMDQLNSANSLWGYGLTGSWHVIGNYPHNFYVEVMYSFGYLLGSVILASLVWVSFKAFYKASYNERGFMLVLFTCSVIKLFISSTLLGEPYLYMYIGYCISLIKKNQVVI